jgi:hypothetical protein
MPDGPVRFVRKRRIFGELDIDAWTLWSWEKSGQFPQSVVLNPAPIARKAWRRHLRVEGLAANKDGAAGATIALSTGPRPKKPRARAAEKK